MGVMPLSDVDWSAARQVLLSSDTDAWITRPAGRDITAARLARSYLADRQNVRNTKHTPELPKNGDVVDYHRSLSEVASQAGYRITFLGPWERRATPDVSPGQPDETGDRDGVRTITQPSDEHAVYVLRIRQTATEGEFWNAAQDFRKPEDYGRPDFLKRPSHFTADYFEGSRNKTKSVTFPDWGGYYPSWLACCYFADSLLYVGESNCLQRRLWEHFRGSDESNLGNFDALVPLGLDYVEWRDSRDSAQQREEELAQDYSIVAEKESSNGIFEGLIQYAHY